MDRQTTLMAISLLQEQGLLGPKESEDGANIVFSCPFIANHGGSRTQRTPSFGIQADKGFFNCFSCKRGGKSIYALYSALAGVSPDDAERAIGRPRNLLQSLEEGLAGLQSNELGPFCKTPYPETIPLLNAPEALAYVRGRGIPDRLSEQAGLCYFPKHVMPPPIDKEDGWTSGRRIIFPLYWCGQRIGYSGRTMEKDVNPKYYRPVERIGQAVYNPCDVDPEAFGEVYVVEGEIDAIVSNREGLPAISIFGSSISASQAAFLARFKKVRLMLDPDDAGAQGREKALAAYMGFTSVMPVYLPRDMDPGAMPMGFGDQVREAVEKADREQVNVRLDTQRRLLDAVRM